MPNDNKLYLCFEYCDYDLKKYMKSLQYKLSAKAIKARHATAVAAAHHRAGRAGRELSASFAAWCWRPPTDGRALNCCRCSLSRTRC